MSAVHKVRRTMTARESAEKLGVSPRQVQRIVAEPREAFLARAKQRQEHALALKDSGLKYREIAELMNLTNSGAISLVNRARKRRAETDAKTPAHNDASLPGQTSIEDVSGE